MPRWNIDNLITHICAAALIVDGFEVDVADLRTDLKLDNRECVYQFLPHSGHLLILFPRIKQYFSELGCRVDPPSEAERVKLKLTKAEAASHWLAKLKLPLKFPKLRTGSNKKR